MGPQSPRNRTDPPPLSEWDPLVIPRSPSGSSGVQPARSELRPPASGGGAAALSRGRVIDAWPALPPDTRKASWPSSRPLRGGNRQIRTTATGVARGVQPAGRYAQELNRPRTPFGRESLTYPAFAQWGIGRSTRWIRTTPTASGGGAAR